MPPGYSAADAVWTKHNNRTSIRSADATPLPDAAGDPPSEQPCEAPPVQSGAHPESTHRLHAQPETATMSDFHNTPIERPHSVLSIAGSDSGGGAGIQADLKTFAALGVHGLTAIAALTAQTTRGVSAVELPSLGFLHEQIRCLLEDFDVRAIKIGMLADASRIHCVADALAVRPDIPIVLDPVMVASSGARLLAADAIDALKRTLLPRATVITPNLPEAEVLVDRALADAEACARAAADLRAAGATWVLMKGGHLGEGSQVHDRLYGEGAQVLSWSQPRLDVSPHGTGCTLSSAIAALLAQGTDVPTAVEQAIGFVHRALRAAYRPGLGNLSVLDHMAARRQPIPAGNPTHTQTAPD